MAGVTTGIIAEYNPLHTGHQYHIDQAVSLSGANRIIAVISGPFTQRGDPALLSPQARAEMALLAGADMVFEIPVLFSVNDANRFAAGGVALLTQLGCTHIAFGCETDDLSLFIRASELIQKPTSLFQSDLHTSLAQGCSYAKALGTALQNAFQTDAFTRPNNILSICYLNAIKALNSPLIPVPIKRLGDYHEKTLPGEGFYPSATAVRHAILRRDWQQVCTMTTAAAYQIIRREEGLRRIHEPNGLDNAMRAFLLAATRESLQSLPGSEEGLDALILKHRDHALTRAAIVTAMKSKRYTYTRLNRLITYMMLSINKEMFYDKPFYTRLLGLWSKSSQWIKEIKGSSLITIIEKAADYDKTTSSFSADIRAYDLWALGAGLPFGEGLRQSPVVDPN